MKITGARSLSNDALAVTLNCLAGAEREATVALILHLAEFDQRQLYRGAGFRCGPHNRLEEERLYQTPPGARDAGGARVDLARVYPSWSG